MTLPAVGASVCASGNQVWKGTAGSLTANARKKPSMSHIDIAPPGATPRRSK